MKVKSVENSWLDIEMGKPQFSKKVVVSHYPPKSSRRLVRIQTRASTTTFTRTGSDSIPGRRREISATNRVIHDSLKFV